MSVSAVELYFRVHYSQEFFFFALLLTQCFRTVIKKDTSNATDKIRIDDVNVCKRFWFSLLLKTKICENY